MWFNIIAYIPMYEEIPNVSIAPFFVILPFKVLEKIKPEFEFFRRSDP